MVRNNAKQKMIRGRFNPKCLPLKQRDCIRCSFQNSKNVIIMAENYTIV